MSSATVEVRGSAVQPAAVRKERSAVRAFFSLPQGVFGSVLFVLMITFIIVGPHLAPYSPDTYFPQQMSGSSSQHLLGTDVYGRDILSRVLTGGTSVVILPAIAIAVSTVISLILGLLSGYLGGKVDLVVEWMMNTALAIPSYLLAIVIVTGFGTGTGVIVAAVAVIYVPYMTRVLRSATQAVAPREFVLAARARGESVRYIVSREIMPNISPTLLCEVAIRYTYAMIFIATLSFLGLGVQPPSSNWGVMLYENSVMILTHPWEVLVPALLIALLAISVNLMADALTQVFSGQVGDSVTL
jgi:peptide/nickel transport system permease protein